MAQRLVTTNPERYSFCSIQITRQFLLELIKGMGEVSPIALQGPLRPPTESCPNLRRWILRLDKQNEALTLRSMGQQQGNCIGLVETREIEKITVLAKRPLTIGVMGRESCGWDHRRCSP